MKASTYVFLLQALITEHGDFECVDTYDEPIGEPEEIEGTFVLADKA